MAETISPISIGKASAAADQDKGREALRGTCTASGSARLIITAASYGAASPFGSSGQSPLFAQKW